MLENNDEHKHEGVQGTSSAKQLSSDGKITVTCQNFTNSPWLFPFSIVLLAAIMIQV